MSNQNTSETYDRGIVPAETAARMEREDKDFKQMPQVPEEEEKGIDTTAGYTVDQEGILNNYAIEPEMYVETPGDLREKEEELDVKRAEELSEVNVPDERGKLTTEGDQRGHGPGVV